MRKSAIISECGLYRYELRREWDADLPPMLMVMLNPSTADADKDDPTIRRCISRAMAEGCGSLIVVNLGAFRATSPKDWMAADDPLGPKNYSHVHNAVLDCESKNGIIVAAWGAHGLFGGAGAFWRCEWAIQNKRIYCLGTTKNDQPKHPLYVSSATPLVEFTRGLA